MVQGYSASNTLNWTPTATGNYNVCVWVKDAASTNNYDAFIDSAVYTISVGQQPVTAISIVPSKTSPQPAGTPITWTCNASGGTSLLYKFYAYNELIGWQVLQDYSPNNIVNWTPTFAGDYTICAQVKDATSTNNYDAFIDSAVYTISKGQQPVTAISIVPSNASPQPMGTPITWTCNASGGTSLLYQFYAYNETTGWQMVQAYSPSNTVNWTPTAAGNYNVCVWVKDAASTNNYDAFIDSAVYTISVGQQPVTAISIVPSKSSPQPANTSITWTCNASGGTSLLYQFFTYNASVGWQVAQGYSSSNTLNWTPTVPGDYYVCAWVKDAASTNNYDAVIDSQLYTINESQ
jgi:6,7-dimethyl-8-ribityllumazine synthase